MWDSNNPIGYTCRVLFDAKWWGSVREITFMTERRNAGENLVTKITSWTWPLMWLACVWGMWALYVAVMG